MLIKKKNPYAHYKSKMKEYNTKCRIILKKIILARLAWGGGILTIKNRRLILLVVIFSMISSLFQGCALGSDYEKEISKLIETKKAAIKEKDIEKYMSTIDSSNKQFYNEQRRWINNVANNNIEEYSLELLKMETIDDISVRATLNQKYKYKNKNYDITYDEKYIKTSDGWKDSDILFQVKETDHFIVKYMKDDTNLDKVITAAEKAYAKITKRYGREPETKTVIKIYSDRELLRQSVDLTIEWQFTGWYEMNEALKVFSGRELGYSYIGLISHELIHRITMEDSNNNIPYWFAEGLAMYFANFHENGGDHLEKGWYTKKDLKLPIKKLEQMDIETMSDNYDIGRYYGVSGIMIKYIDLKYGRENLMEIIHELGKHPYSENIKNQNFDKENQQKLREAVKNVLGKDLDTISNDWIKWIENI